MFCAATTSLAYGSKQSALASPQWYGAALNGLHAIWSAASTAHTCDRASLPPAVKALPHPAWMLSILVGASYHCNDLACTNSIWNSAQQQAQSLPSICSLCASLLSTGRCAMADVQHCCINWFRFQSCVVSLSERLSVIQAIQ